MPSDKDSANPLKIQEQPDPGQGQAQVAIQNLHTNHDSPDMLFPQEGTGILDLAFTLPESMQHCSVVSFQRTHNSPEESNSLIQMSYSFDGQHYQEALSLSGSHGPDRWEAMENSRVTEIMFPKNVSGRELHIRYQFLGNAGLVFDPSTNKKPLRRLEVDFYPAKVWP